MKLVYLYPELMNLYGDRGNIMALEKRLAWRGLNLKVKEVSLGEALPLDCDFIFMGGGQDQEQLVVAADIKRLKPQLTNLINAGVVTLLICGGFQLFGRYFRTFTGERLEGLGILDLETVGGEKRLIGNVVIQSLLPDLANQTLVGFENHSGRTFLGPEAKPLGKVVVGYGNNGQDGYEGAYYKNCFGTYLHGSFLPKNPHFTDHLIKLALKRKGINGELKPLNDAEEMAAHQAAIKKARAASYLKFIPSWFRR